MQIVKATPAHLAQILELEKRLFGATAWAEATILEELEGNHRSYWVLVDQNEVYGYGGVLTIGSDSDIQTIAVDPQMQGMGHGKKLLTKLLAEATEAHAKQVFLEVRADNEAAKSLYLQTGFKEVGVRPKYYQPDGVDAVIMQLQLSELRETSDDQA